jgi:hypothetical protein
MAHHALIGRDDIERMKVYVEIVKYVIVIVIALATVCGTLLKTSESPSALQIWFFAIGIVANLTIFFVGHRLTSEALRAITVGFVEGGVAEGLAEINRTTYSLFVLLFLLSLLYWSVAILLIALN